MPEASVINVYKNKYKSGDTYQDNSMSPRERYQADLLKDEFSVDPAQRIAVDYTQQLYETLVREYENKGGLISRLKKTFSKRNNNNIKGLYFWGGVGRGKTYIVDAFFETLPLHAKERIHFHRFMQKIHHELKQLKDVENPLQLIAGNYANNVRVLCFDEFHVTDITDAMLLGGLLQALFEHGLVLVTTSNEAPDQLYHDGLQRDRFLPAIALIKEFTHVVNVDSGIDYRLRYLDKAEIYHTPPDEKADSLLQENFTHIAPDTGRERATIEIEGRKIVTVCRGDGVVWFDFPDICDGPRGPADYIEIARQYQTVLISNIPVFTDFDNDRVTRFMMLVDEFYDRNVKLIVSAAGYPEQLYAGTCLNKVFQRTVSRLQEMRTHDYLAKQHLS